MLLILFSLNFYSGFGIFNGLSEFVNLTYGFIPCFNMGIEGKGTIEYFEEIELLGDKGAYSYCYLSNKRELKMSFYGFLFKAGINFSEELSLLKNLGIGVILGWIKEKRPLDYTDGNSTEILEGSDTAPGIFFYFKTGKHELFHKIKTNLRAEMLFISFRTIRISYDYLYISGLSLDGIKINLIFYYE